MLYAVLGVALGQLTRSIPAAIVIVLVTPLVIEPVISALPDWTCSAGCVTSFPTCRSLPACSWSPPGYRLQAQDGAALGRWEGGAVFAAIRRCVLLAIGWLLFERRDA